MRAVQAFLRRFHHTIAWESLCVAHDDVEGMEGLVSAKLHLKGWYSWVSPACRTPLLPTMAAPSAMNAGTLITVPTQREPPIGPAC